MFYVEFRFVLGNFEIPHKVSYPFIERNIRVYPVYYYSRVLYSLSIVGYITSTESDRYGNTICPYPTGLSHHVALLQCEDEPANNNGISELPSSR